MNRRIKLERLNKIEGKEEEKKKIIMFMEGEEKDARVRLHIFEER
jgi:hypothetical protein